MGFALFCRTPSRPSLDQKNDCRPARAQRSPRLVAGGFNPKVQVVIEFIRPSHFHDDIARAGNLSLGAGRRIEVGQQHQHHRNESRQGQEYDVPEYGLGAVALFQVINPVHDVRQIPGSS